MSEYSKCFALTLKLQERVDELEEGIIARDRQIQSMYKIQDHNQTKITNLQTVVDRLAEPLGSIDASPHSALQARIEYAANHATEKS